MPAQSINNTESWEIEVFRQFYQDLLKVILAPFWIAVPFLWALPEVFILFVLAFWRASFVGMGWIWLSHFIWFFPVCFCHWSELEMDSKRAWRGGRRTLSTTHPVLPVDQRPASPTGRIPKSPGPPTSVLAPATLTPLFVAGHEILPNSTGTFQTYSEERSACGL